MPKRWMTVLAAVVSAVAGAALVGAVQNIGAANAATSQTYVRTLTGTDFRPLDIRIHAQFVSGTGGGIYAIYQDDGTHTKPDAFLEAPLDLPVGAQLTQVSFFYRDCGSFGFDVSMSFYAGSYVPSTGAYTPIVNETQSMVSRPCPTKTFTRTGSPLASVGDGHRYILGVRVSAGILAETMPQFQPYVFAGARIKYTCSATCR